MSPRYHPTEMVLAGYASGALADGPSLAVSAHLEACPACRASVRLLEAVGGALLDETPEASMAEDALALALARIERPQPVQASVEPATTVLDGFTLPTAIARRGVGPRRWVGPGIWVAPIRSNSPDTWRTYLLRVPPRVEVPHHGHNGPEFTAVLHGVFRDEDDVYRAGDFAETGSGMEHHPTVDGYAPCLCLISGQGGVRATGLLRVIQPLLGV